MGLTAVSYLGPNTVSILDDLSGYLTETTGIEVTASRAARTSRQAIDGSRTERGDLIWACGHLTMKLLAGDPGCLEVIGTPVFTGEPGPVYHAVIVVRGDGPKSLIDAVDLTLGINEVESWSGHLGLRAHATSEGLDGWFTDVVVTGSHVESVGALAAGSVDIVSVDNTVWDQLVREPPDSLRGRLEGLEVIGRTIDWPAPPMSVSSAVDASTAAGISSALWRIEPGTIGGLDAISRATHTDYAELAP